LNCPTVQKDGADRRAGGGGFRHPEIGGGWFCQPHAHTGLAIRKLGKHLYECRTGLTWRLVFEAHKGVLIF